MKPAVLRFAARARAAIVALLTASAVVACAAPPPPARAPIAPRAAKLEDALDGEPDLLAVVRPRALARDPLYGPLFRHASTLASTKGNAASVGTTALAAFERADEMLVAVYDRGGRDAVVAVRGVPADIDPVTLIEPGGKPLWERVHEDRESHVTELVSTDPKSDAALFVLPMRTWVIAVGDAVARANAVYMQRGVPTGVALDVDPEAVALLRIRGAALARHEVRLQVGPLAPIGRALDSAEIALAPGGQGEWSGRLLYASEPSARESGDRIEEVLGAFVRKFGDKMRWLADIHVTRAPRAVTLRGKLPHAWIEGLLEAGQAPPPEATSPEDLPPSTRGGENGEKEHGLSKPRAMPFDTGGSVR